MKFNWSQEGNKLILVTEKGETHWIMPNDWKIENTHQDIFRLIEALLYDNWGDMISIKKRNEEYKSTRKFGKNIGLSFSGGVDSTAAMCVLPEDTKLVYHERDEDLGGALDQTNALHMIDEVREQGKEVIIVKSNHEKIRMYYGQIRGFASDWVPASGLILLADYLNLGYICYGTTLGESYIDRGYSYRDFYNHPAQVRWRKAFNNAGLHLTMPVGGISEVAINKIVQASPYKDLANSCIRSKIIGEGCKICSKCWRKSMLNGWEMKDGFLDTQEMKNKLNPLYQAHTVIYGCKKKGKWPKELEPYVHMNVDWVEKYYSHALNLVPKELREGLKNKYKEYGIEYMGGIDIAEMQEFSVLN